MKNVPTTPLTQSAQHIAFVLLILSVFVLTSCGADSEPTQDLTFDYVTYQSEALISATRHNYYDDGSSNLSLTLYNVENSTDQSKPLVLLAPGGGFDSYNRVNELSVLARDLAHRGYATAVVYYTVNQPNADTWYKAFLDIKAAIKYLKKNAEELEIDPDKIFSGGWSSGAQIAIKAAHLDLEEYTAIKQELIHTVLDSYASNGLEPSIYAEYSSDVKGTILLLPTSWDEDYFDADGPAILMVGSERSKYSSGSSMWGTSDVNGIIHAGGDVLFAKAEEVGYVDGDNLELYLAPVSLDASYDHVNYTVLDEMFYDNIAQFIQRNLD